MVTGDDVEIQTGSGENRGSIDNGGCAGLRDS